MTRDPSEGLSQLYDSAELSVTATRASASLFRRRHICHIEKTDNSTAAESPLGHHKNALDPTTKTHSTSAQCLGFIEPTIQHSRPLAQRPAHLDHHASPHRVQMPGSLRQSPPDMVLSGTSKSPPPQRRAPSPASSLQSTHREPAGRTWT